MRKLIPSSSSRKPWMTRELIRLVRKKNKLYKTFVKTRNSDDLIAFKRFRNQVTGRLKQAKAAYYKGLFNESKVHNTKLLWKNLNDVLNRKTRNDTFENVSVGGNIIRGQDLAEHFNAYFINACDSNCQATPYDPCESLQDNLQSTIFLSPVEENEMFSAFFNLKNTRSLDVYDMQILPIKRVLYCILGPLTYIVNQCFSSGSFPKRLQVAKVSVIHKGGNRNEVSNYRPVSVLPVFSKGFEKVIYVRLLAFLDAHSVITNSQFGFRKHCSTELALLTQKEIILRNFERNHLTLGVFIDFSKAFDSISHEILARKLYRYGIRGNALALLTSYLEDRFQRVAVNYSISSARKIKYGVPQGSILGPLLFNLYINDIVSLSSDATFIIYADDTSLFFSGTKGDTLVANANVVLRKICVWANSNSLKINATKTKAVLFRPRNRKIVLTSSIMLASETIEMSSVVKTLGVYFTEHMSWIHHIEQLRLKVSRVVGALCRCRHLLTSEIVRILYNALIQSHFTYCHLVWGVGSSFSSLLVVQKRYFV